MIFKEPEKIEHSRVDIYKGIGKTPGNKKTS